ncbi:MAG TPA: MFS transporter [Acetobacteraceae bacterium]|nr:MFS transporter [Acetobacteraceae bacterium]
MRPNPARPALPFIFAVLVIDSLGFGLIVPILPELVQKLSGSGESHAALWVGVLSMTFAATQFFAGPVLGQLSDRFGRRKLILTSLAGSAANYLLLAFAPSVAWLFLGRLLAGATSGNVSAATAYIADITPPEQRAHRFGMIGASFGLGFTLGPTLGGLLGGIDLRLPFLAAAGLVALNVLYGLFVLPESLPPERRRPFRLKEATPLGSFRMLRANPRMIRLTLAWCVRWFGIGALQAVFVLFTELRFHWGPEQNGLALGVMGVTATIVQATLVKPAVARLGERRAALLGFALNASGYLLVGLAPAPGLIFLGIGLMAFGSIANPAIRALLSNAVPADQQGRLNGTLSAVEGLTIIVAPLTGALVFDLFTRDPAWSLPGAPFLLTTIFLSVAFWLVASTTKLPVNHSGSI